MKISNYHIVYPPQVRWKRTLNTPTSIQTRDKCFHDNSIMVAHEYD